VAQKLKKVIQIDWHCTLFRWSSIKPSCSRQLLFFIESHCLCVSF